MCTRRIREERERRQRAAMAEQVERDETELEEGIIAAREWWDQIRAESPSPPAQREMPSLVLQRPTDLSEYHIPSQHDLDAPQADDSHNTASGANPLGTDHPLNTQINGIVPSSPSIGIHSEPSPERQNPQHVPAPSRSTSPQAPEIPYVRRPVTRTPPPTSTAGSDPETMTTSPGGTRSYVGGGPSSEDLAEALRQIRPRDSLQVSEQASPRTSLSPGIERPASVLRHEVSDDGYEEQAALAMQSRMHPSHSLDSSSGQSSASLPPALTRRRPNGLRLSQEDVGIDPGTDADGEQPRTSIRHRPCWEAFDRYGKYERVDS